MQQEGDICVWHCCADTLHLQKWEISMEIKHIKHPFRKKEREASLCTAINSNLWASFTATVILQSVFSNACSTALCRKSQLWISRLSRFGITITWQFPLGDNKEGLSLHHSNYQTSETECTPQKCCRLQGMGLSDGKINGIKTLHTVHCIGPL